MRFLGRCAGATLIVACSLSTAAQPSFRIIPYAHNRPITEALLPDDAEVVVQRHADRHIYHPEPTGREEVQMLLADSFDSVVIVQAGDIEGRFVSEGRWIATFFSGAVERILRTQATASSDIRVGQRLTFSVDGGMLKSGAVLVKTEGAPAYPPGRSYLVFVGRVDPETGVRHAGTGPLLVERNRLTSVGPTTRRMASLSLSQVADTVRRFR